MMCDIGSIATLQKVAVYIGRNVRLMESLCSAGSSSKTVLLRKDVVYT